MARTQTDVAGNDATHSDKIPARSTAGENDKAKVAGNTSKTKAISGSGSGTGTSVANKDATNSIPDNNTPPTPTKIGTVLALLSRAEGVTLDELVTATGWQPHSVRAALTGLKKKGHVIDKSKRADATCYRITDAA